MNAHAIHPWAGRRAGRVLVAVVLLGSIAFVWSCGSDGTAPAADGAGVTSAANPAGTATGAGGPNGDPSELSGSPISANATAVKWFGAVEILLPEEKHLAGRYGKNFRILTITEGESPNLSTFAWESRDKPLPGLVIISSNYLAGAKSCQNLAKYATSEIAQRTPEEIEFLNDWLVTSTSFAAGVPGTLRAALVGDKNHNGKYDDAPAVVPDYDKDGVCTGADLWPLGLASDISRSHEWQVNSN
jgi:hypothetical protein